MTRKRTRTAITREQPSFVLPLGRFLTFTLLSLLLFLPARLSARNPAKTPRHALIFGTVWGPDDRPLAGMEVKIRRANEKKARWTLISNRRGEFEAEVPAGPADYVVRAETRHYKLPSGKHLQPSPEVTVHVENDERADTGLHLK